ncbi:hypothetical protein HYU16_02800 [Candidatus Woesearchaeota archaeon]|nr:hypothetical protein [Candidatus Woesearchaeota archaeon]
MTSNGKTIVSSHNGSSFGGLEQAVRSPFSVRASIKENGTVLAELTEGGTNVFLSNGKSRMAASGSYQRGRARVRVNGHVVHAPPSTVSVTVSPNIPLYGTGGISQAETVIGNLATELQKAYLGANRQPLPENVPIKAMVSAALQMAIAAYRL